MMYFTECYLSFILEVEIRGNIESTEDFQVDLLTSAPQLMDGATLYNKRRAEAA